jgi:hypothetical protein
MMEIVSLLIGIIGVGLSVYFYTKSKKIDEVSRGFYLAIARQADSILGELMEAEGIRNPDAFQTLRAKTSSIKIHVSSLMNTISTFDDTMWKKK